MKRNSKFLLVACAGLVLSACSSNEETIDVTKPEMEATKIDLMNGQMQSTGFTDSTSRMALSEISRPGVEIFSLDGPAADIREQYSSGQSTTNFGNVGNSNVQITNIGQPSMPSMTRSSQPVKKKTGSAVNRANGQLLQTIYFNHGSHRLDASDMQMISSIASEFKSSPNMHLHVEGHASPTAEATNALTRKQINLDIALERAEAVTNALIAQGVNADRIRTSGWGEEKAIQGDENASRRVEVFRVSK